MVLDLHKTLGYSFDQGERQSGFFENVLYQERFYRLWETLAYRFGNYHGIAFELLNEVTEIGCMKLWCEIVGNCIQRIRAVAPMVDILIGGYWNNSVASVKDLPEPVDKHIIYNLHCYEPLIFTHQGAPWLVGMPFDFRMSYKHTGREYYEQIQSMQPEWNESIGFFAKSEKPIDDWFFEQLFIEAVNIANERNVPLYCGEYGDIDYARPQETIAWYQSIHRVFHKYGIGHCAWTYKQMNFGLRDPHYQPILDDILDSM